MLIEITQEDINNGEKYSYHKCPFTLAMERYGIKTAAWNYSFPEIDMLKICRWVDDFNAGKEVKPVSFHACLKDVYKHDDN